ncbi:MAG: PAC2 family protein [Rothia sp. (in: high G+C Gram-positive bacteria)]|nr:PAC2 family protein [Rothia sp. (in: high G+C Gram-positive bacteria)]
MINQPLPLNALDRFATASAQPGHAPTVLLVSFSGWNDAGDATIEAFRAIWEHYPTTPMSGFDTSGCYNYTETRPLLSIDDKGTQRITWPESIFTEAQTTSGIRLLTLSGPEPSMNWQTYSDRFKDFIAQEKIDLVVFCGALLDEVPHTRPLPLSVTSFTSSVLALDGVETNTYQGPTGLIGVLAYEAGKAQIPALSLWVSVPHYLPEPPHPKATFTLLSALEAILGFPLPLERSADDIANWNHQADALTEDEPDLANYVRTLESIAEATDDIADLSHIDIAAQFEKFLKDQDDN